jgi:hypothetical protein
MDENMVEYKSYIHISILGVWGSILNNGAFNHDAESFNMGDLHSACAETYPSVPVEKRKHQNAQLKIFSLFFSRRIPTPKYEQ